MTKILNKTGMTLDTPSGKLRAGEMLDVPQEWFDKLKSNAIWSQWFKEGKLEIVPDVAPKSPAKDEPNDL